MVLKELSFEKKKKKKKNKLFFKIQCCHGKQTELPLVIKHINWIDIHLMIIAAKYGSHYFSGYGENATKSFSHYKSVGVFC